MKHRVYIILGLVVVLAVGGGCGRGQKADKVPAPTEEAVGWAALTAEQLVANPELLHERLRATNPQYQGGALVALQPEAGLVGQINLKTVTNLSALRGIPFAALDLMGTPVADLLPLHGMPLVMLGLEKTQVTDLEPLRGSKLQKLYLNHTAVSDLEPLKGMPIEELMLVNTKVSNLAPLRGMPLKMLWLNNTEVADIAPISACPLISLTLAGTAVADVSPLANHPTLQRLHIGSTKVRDLSSLGGVKLVRLIFTPSDITNGLDVARDMTTLKELGMTLEGLMPPEKFWALHDRQK